MTGIDLIKLINKYGPEKEVRIFKSGGFEFGFYNSMETWELDDAGIHNGCIILDYVQGNKRKDKL